MTFPILHEPETFFAIRSDRNQMPIIEEFEMSREKNRYIIITPVKSNKCVFNPYDIGELSKIGAMVGMNRISKDLDRGWCFNTKSDAIERVSRMSRRLIYNAEKAMETAMAVTARLEMLRGNCD